MRTFLRDLKRIVEPSKLDQRLVIEATTKGKVIFSQNAARPGGKQAWKPPFTGKLREGKTIDDLLSLIHQHSERLRATKKYGITMHNLRDIVLVRIGGERGVIDAEHAELLKDHWLKE